MRETRFIEQNKKKWSDFETSLRKKEVHPGLISKLFVEITGDLSWARTFYPNRSVRLYLNGLAKLLYNDISKNSSRRWKDFKLFWTQELPLAMYEARRAMLISFIAFWSCILLGIITSKKDPAFAKEVLGASYVAMTEKNIAQNKPMDVYASSGEGEMFFGIAFNNLFVSFRTFFMGIFMSVGAFVVIVYNGIMVGVFQYFFIERGLFIPSFLSIWTHGTLEISAIIMAGGAGMLFGKGMLFPGTYSRFQAFKMSARLGLKIMAGLTPVILTAAFIESFLTRYTSIPDPLRFFFILLSLAFVLIYFAWYPHRVARNSSGRSRFLELYPDRTEPAAFGKKDIAEGTDVFSASVRLLASRLPFFLRLIVLLAVFTAVILAYDDYSIFTHADKGRYNSFKLYDLINAGLFPPLALLTASLSWITILFSTAYVKYVTLQKNTAFGLQRIVSWRRLLSSAAAVLIVSGIHTLGGAWNFLIIVLLPFLVLVNTVSYYTSGGFVNAVGVTAGLLRFNWLRFLGLSLLCFFFQLPLLMLSSSALPYVVFSDAVFFLTDDYVHVETLRFAFMVFLTVFNYIFYHVLVCIVCGTFYHSLYEAATAESLFRKIRSIRIKH